MDNYTQQDILEFWQKGKFLNEAIMDLCDRKYVERYKKIDLEEDDDITNYHQYCLEKEYALNKLYEDLYKKIIRGKLIAIGFKYPIESKFPVLIPPYMWPPENVEINKSAISSNEIEFQKIRIIKSSLITKSHNNPHKIILPDTKIENKSGGRPTKKEVIEQAYKLLKSENRIDFDTTLKPHTKLIQDTVKDLDKTIEGTVGISYKAIYKHLSEHFNKDKEEYLNRL